ncbi:MAG TPA: hypothetical protein VE844_00550 [Gammaproteobacteria bacterium]|nr:hypothetical protein [Gammaproteobacteria bacterium]
MKITASRVIRWSGLSAIAAGIIFVVTQPLHPPDVLSSVTTPRWAIVHIFSTAMCFLALLGITGLYARQVEETGWLGLVGYIVFSLFWALQTPYSFVEAFLLPQLTTAAPEVVQGSLAIVVGGPGMNLGAFATVYQVVGLLYTLGGLLFGIATLRAGILSRWAAGLLTVAPLVAPVGALLPGELVRIAAVPMGIALAWLGYALWSERRGQASDPVVAGGSPQPR